MTWKNYIHWTHTYTDTRPTWLAHHAQITHTPPTCLLHSAAPWLSGEPATPGPRTGSQTGLLLEAVKMGILSSLGMDREPRLSQKATVQELRKMHQLYKEKLREMQGNSSQMLKETWRPRVATLPDTGETLDRDGSKHCHTWNDWHNFYTFDWELERMFHSKFKKSCTVSLALNTQTKPFVLSTINRNCPYSSCSRWSFLTKCMWMVRNRPTVL